jgi:hypothetical protein
MRQHPNLGRLLQAAPLDGVKSLGVTYVKLSPSAEYCLLGYGVRENIPSVNEYKEQRHSVTSMYNVKRGIKHVCTCTCAVIILGETGGSGNAVGVIVRGGREGRGGVGVGPSLTKLLAEGEGEGGRGGMKCK